MLVILALLVLKRARAASDAASESPSIRGIPSSDEELGKQLNHTLYYFEDGFWWPATVSKGNLDYTNYMVPRQVWNVDYDTHDSSTTVTLQKLRTNNCWVLGKANLPDDAVIHDLEAESTRSRKKPKAESTQSSKPKAEGKPSSKPKAEGKPNRKHKVWDVVDVQWTVHHVNCKRNRHNLETLSALNTIPTKDKERLIKNVNCACLNKDEVELHIYSAINGDKTVAHYVFVPSRTSQRLVFMWAHKDIRANETTSPAFLLLRKCISRYFVVGTCILVDLQECVRKYAYKFVGIGFTRTCSAELVANRRDPEFLFYEVIGEEPKPYKNTTVTGDNAYNPIILDAPTSSDTDGKSDQPDCTIHVVLEQQPHDGNEANENGGKPKAEDKPSPAPAPAGNISKEVNVVEKYYKWKIDNPGLPNPWQDYAEVKEHKASLQPQENNKQEAKQKEISTELKNKYAATKQKLQALQQKFPAYNSAWWSATSILSCTTEAEVRSKLRQLKREIHPDMIDRAFQEYAAKDNEKFKALKALATDVMKSLNLLQEHL